MMFMQTEIKMWKMVLGLRFSPPAPRLRRAGNLALLAKNL